MYSSYERESTWKTTVTFKSGSVVTDPSGNRAFVKVYRPDGTTMIDSSGQRSSTGIYYYYVSTQSTDDLGIYRIKWTGWFDYSKPWDYAPKVEQSAVIITIVD